MNAPSAIRAARPSMRSRRAARTIGTGSARWRSELEPAGAALTREHRAQIRDRLFHLRERAAERDAVPLLDDHVRRGAEAEHEAAVAHVGDRRGGLRQDRRAARVDIDDAGRQPQPGAVLCRDD